MFSHKKFLRAKKKLGDDYKIGSRWYAWKTTESVYSIAYKTVDWYELDITTHIAGQHNILSIWADSNLRNWSWIRTRYPFLYIWLLSLIYKILSDKIYFTGLDQQRTLCSIATDGGGQGFSTCLWGIGKAPSIAKGWMWKNLLWDCNK